MMHKEFPVLLAGTAGVTSSREELVEAEESAANNSEQSSSVADLFNGNNSVKTQLLEKRKQEGNWKGLRKIDYQRLETVVEEVQPSDSLPYKFNNESEETHKELIPSDDQQTTTCKPGFSTFMFTTKNGGLLNSDAVQLEIEHQMQEKHQHQDQISRRHRNGERGDETDMEDRELATTNGSVILNGIMEILPIFSNVNFLCSRDTISIEECEEMETSDKTFPSLGKQINEKRKGDNQKTDIKPFQSRNTEKNGINRRLAERIGNLREAAEKIRIKESTIIENNFKKTSHFINFLLVLTPFAEERERLLNGKALAEDNIIACKDLSQQAVEKLETQKKGLPAFRITHGMILVTFGLISALLAIVWGNVETSGLFDIIVEYVPIIRSRRTHLRIFYNKLIFVIFYVTTTLSHLCQNFYNIKLR